MIEKLFNSIQNKNSSYIFVGLDGVGKRYNATMLAKASLCGAFPPCETCSNCTRINKLMHPNLIFIEPDGKDIKIEQIRDTLKSLVFKPAESGKRFIIITKAHRLNNSSANAILKALEEPPRDTIFILCTINLYTLLPTIVSRCEVIKFPPLKNDKIAKILNIDINNPLLEYSQGSVNKTLFYIDHTCEFKLLLDLLNSKTINYNQISKITTLLMDKIPSDINSIENVFSFIIKFLSLKTKFYLDKNIDIGNILSSIEKIKVICKKLYLNTPANLIIENILIESGKCLGDK